jgi:hypothetical protein
MNVSIDESSLIRTPLIRRSFSHAPPPFPLGTPGAIKISLRLAALPVKPQGCRSFSEPGLVAGNSENFGKEINFSLKCQAFFGCFVVSQPQGCGAFSVAFGPSRTLDDT